MDVGQVRPALRVLGLLEIEERLVGLVDLESGLTVGVDAGRNARPRGGWPVAPTLLLVESVEVGPQLATGLHHPLDLGTELVVRGAAGVGDVVAAVKVRLRFPGHRSTLPPR